MTLPDAVPTPDAGCECVTAGDLGVPREIAEPWTVANLCQPHEIEALKARIAQLEMFAQVNFNLREELSQKLAQHRFFADDLRKLKLRGAGGKGWLPVSGRTIHRLLVRRGLDGAPR